MANMALAFDIMARDKGASRTFNQIGDSADRAGKKGAGFGKGIKIGIGAVVGAIASLGIGEVLRATGDLLSDSIGEAREAQKVGRTTAQIIKSTGGAAKITADQVGDLANRISLKAGVDDEAIQSGANLLLTFKNVRNEIGKGANIFDRATTAAVDLSAAGFGSVEGASKMLGKALNDPIKGISALGRAGVTFTDQQKKQIKTLVKSGDTLKAQKIILGEVESQVGGVAGASASMGDKVKVAFANIKESIGNALLPILDRLGQWFLSVGLPALKRFGGWLTGNVWPALQAGAKVILPALLKAFGDVTGAVGDGGFSWKKLGDYITQKVIPTLAVLIREDLPQIVNGVKSVIAIVKGCWKAFQTFMSIVKSVGNVVLSVFIKVTRVGAAMLEALSHVPGFGWAKDAARKMRAAADEADALKTAINRIPTSKSVDLWVRTRQTGRIRLPNGATVNVGMRAGGGPVSARTPYAVGDNPDGSWNKTTELFVPNTAGHVYNQKQLAAMAAGGSASSGGGYTRLHPHDIAAIVDGITARPNQIVAGSFDAAIGARI